MNGKLEKILSIPKSLWVSKHFFGWKDALKLPMLVRYNCVLDGMAGTVKIKSGGVSRGMFQLGFGNIRIFDKRYDRSMLCINGTLELNGTACLGHGSRLNVNNGGTLSIGDGFINTARTTIVCAKRISLGRSVVTSWDTLIMDTDFHSLQDTHTQVVYPCEKDVCIGDRVWIGMRSVVLKGTVIPNGCVVAANSVCCKKYTEENSLLAGQPAVVKKHNVQKEE